MVDKAITPVEINRAIRKQSRKSKVIKIGGLSGQDSIAVGMDEELELMVIGEAGDFLGALNEKAVITMEGKAGNYVGDCMRGGGIIVNGEVGNGAGAYLSGGIVVIRGNAGNGAGVANRGGTVVIAGDAGDDTGLLQSSGTIIVTGNVRRRIGHLISGGEIYVGGKADSLGDNVRILRPSESDLERLKLYFEHYGIEEAPGEFKKIVPRDESPLPKINMATVHDRQTGLERICLPAAVIYSPGPMDFNYEETPRLLNTIIGKEKAKVPLVSRVPVMLRLPAYMTEYPELLAEISGITGKLGISAIYEPVQFPVGSGDDDAPRGLLARWSPDRHGMRSAAIRASSGVILDMTSNVITRRGAYHIHPEDTGPSGEIHGPAPVLYRHADMASIKDLKKHIILLRELTGYRIPVIMRIEAGHLREDLRLSSKVEPDAVIVRFVPSQTDGETYPFLGAFPNIRRLKKDRGGIAELPVGVEVPPISGREIIKCLALGADFVVLDPTMLLACGECPACRKGGGCERFRTGLFDGKDGARLTYGEKLKDVMDSIEDECRTSLVSLSLSEPGGLSSEHLYALDYDTASLAGIKLAGYHRKLPMWSH